jgi:hypothetical protein
MQSITQLVTDSLTRHNFHLAVDPKRLQWSAWFHCHSAASLLAIPSRPGIVALAEAHAPTGVLACPSEPSSAAAAPLVLAAFQFTASDNMAYTIDRLFTEPSLLRSRLSSGRCHLRYVVLENESERRSVSATLNQWLLERAQKLPITPANFSIVEPTFGSAKGQPQSGEGFQLTNATCPNASHPRGAYQGTASAVPPVAV